MRYIKQMLLENARAFDDYATQDTIWNHVQETLNAFEITSLIYITVDQDFQDPILLTSIPQLYDGNDPAKDPFLSHCCHSYDITLTGPSYLPDYQYLPPEAQNFILRARDSGFESGLGIPMRLQGSHRFGGFNVGTRFEREEFEQRILLHSEALRTFCLLAHRRLEEVAAEPAPTESGAGRTRLVAPENSALAKLTPREREVAYLVAQGFSRKECARMCQLSPHTVADYLKCVYRKLGIKDRMVLSHLLTDAQRHPPT